MKKVLTKALAGFLGVAMMASLAYVPPVTSSDEYQLRLDSIKAVDVQVAISGVRAYQDLIDTTRGYQVNDQIYLATTVQVLNLEKDKYRTLKSIEDKDIPAVIGSTHVDLSLSKYNTPILLSHIYSNINETPIGTVANVLNVSNVVDYDKDKNEVEITFRGYQQNAVTWVTGFSTNNLNNLYLAAAIQDGKVMLPALRAKDGKTTVALGTTSYQYDWTAPESMNYTIVLTGITKDNAGAAKGDYYAKIQISGAEKFVKKYEYFVNQEGKAFKDLEVEFGKDAKPIEFVDYIRVPVSVLEIKNAYDVYKYDVKSNGMIYAPVEIVYASDNSDYLNADQSGKVLAHVNPNLYDNTVDKNNKTAVDVAGGVNTEEKAIVDYTYDASTKTFKNIKYGKVPLSSVVYTNNYTVYAPAYYGISTTSGDKTPRTAYVDTIEPAQGSTTAIKKVVDHYEFPLTFDGTPDAWNKAITVIDVYTGKLIAGYSVDGGANGTGVPQYRTEWKPTNSSGTTGILYVYPLSDTIYPIGQAQDSSEMQSWYIHIGVPLKGYKTLAAAGINASSSGYPPYASTWKTGEFVDAIYIPTTDQPNLAAPLGPEVATPANSYDYASATNKFETAYYMDGVNNMPTVGAIKNASVPVVFAAANYKSGPKDNFDWAAKEVTKEVKLTYNLKGLQMTLRTGWNFVNGAEKATGDIVDPSKLPGFTITGVDGAWTSNQMWAPQSVTINNWGTTGAANDADDLADAKVNADGILVQLTGKTETGDWSAVGSAGIDGQWGSKDFENYSMAFVTDSVHSVWGGDVASPGTPSALSGHLSTGQLLNPPYDATWVAATSSATHIPIQSVGWAQKQSMPRVILSSTQTPSSALRANNLSYGLPNARIRVLYNLSGGSKYIQREDPMCEYLAIADNGDAHNGITTYVIAYNTTDQPIIGVATEMTFFKSTNGSSIAFFDAYNTDQLAKRVLRSQDTNLTYANGAGFVKDSSRLIAALRYFGLDTSFTTGYKVAKEVFEDKGAPAIFSKEITGQFSYGNLTLYDEEVDEGTDETEVTDEPSEDPATDEPTEDVPTDEVPTEEVPTDDVPTDDVAPVSDAPRAPKTGDASASTAIALAATAIVAAAGLVFVMKKARR